MKTRRVSNVSRRSRDRDAVLKARILESARVLFLSRGFVHVTADDLAGDLGISKATLYQAFPSKADILREVVRGVLGETDAGVREIIGDDSRGFVEKMVALFSFLGARVSEFGPVFVRDLQKSAPGIWKEIDDFRRGRILTRFEAILVAGRREGIFREDVEPHILLEMFLGLVREFINPAAILRSGRTASEAFESIIKVFFQGILTEKGRRDFARKTTGLFAPLKEIAS